MTWFDDIELTAGADRTLEQIGGKTEKRLFCLLQELKHVRDRREITDLDWQDAGMPTRMSWRIGNFAVVFHERRDVHGRRIAVVEDIVLTQQLSEFADAAAAEAKRREDVT